MFRIRLKETLGGLIGAEERFDFGTQAGIAPACGVEEAGPLIRRELQSVIENTANLLPSLRIQGFASRRLP